MPSMEKPHEQDEATEKRKKKWRKFASGMKSHETRIGEIDA